MHPTLLKLGPISIHSYGLLIATGFLVALFLMRRDAKKVGINPDQIADVAFGVLFLGLVGTRLLHIIMFPSQYSWSDPIGWIAIWKGGLVFQGAIPPAIAFCVYYVYKKGIPIWTFADVVCPYVPLAHAFGRMGCFMYGCCYGHRTDVPWGVSFPKITDASGTITGSPAFLDHAARFGVPPDASWSYPVHPTQLYSAAGLVILCGLLLLLRRYGHLFNGITFPAYLGLYGVFRFIVEFYRGDQNPTGLASGLLSDQQIFSLFAVVGSIILGVIMYLHQKRHEKKAQEAAKS